MFSYLLDEICRNTKGRPAVPETILEFLEKQNLNCQFQLSSCHYPLCIFGLGAPRLSIQVRYGCPGATLLNHHLKNRSITTKTKFVLSKIV